MGFFYSSERYDTREEFHKYNQAHKNLEFFFSFRHSQLRSTSVLIKTLLK